MAATQNTESTQYLAGEDMTDWQYKQVRISGAADKTVLKADAAGDAKQLTFTLLNKPRQGEGAVVAFGGRTLAEAGAAFARELQLETDATGRLIQRSGNGFVNAVAIEAAAAAGEVVEVYVLQYYR